MQHEQHQQFFVPKFVAHLLKGNESLIFIGRQHVRIGAPFQPAQQVHTAIRPLVKFIGQLNDVICIVRLLK